ncbi:MAG: hypothetical protein H6698_09645 [Myxococcales bacterium]|nr:hypothetical protein [Myxococcales bacterium]MCB9532643.1 hypothetical protein [Myxococcales bacterium]MCB9534545.1 hypothetical protein [Myxococcales bacterium]
MKVPWTNGAWPVPAGFLYAWVSTRVPGYGAVDVASSVYTAAAGYYRGDDFVGAVDAAAPGTWAVDDRGQVRTTQSSLDVTAVDRSLWVMGFGREVGDVETVTTWYAPYVSPIIIPHRGATWEAVDLSRDAVDIDTDATMRALGDVWGAARVWRWTVDLDPYAYAAFRQGWCMRGRVTLEGATADELASDEPGGALTGQVVAVEGVAWRSARALTQARVSLIVVGGGS